MAKKTAKKSTKKRAAPKRAAKKTASKRAAKSTAQKTVPAQAPVVTQPRDEHLVLSHLMYILFLFSSGLAAVYTVQFLIEKATLPEYYGVAAIVFLGWAFLFKLFAHKVHAPN